MTRGSIALGLVVFLLICYVYYIQFWPGYYEKIHTDVLIGSGMLKTGDLILFKPYDNMRAVVTGYFTHIGVVYVDPETQQPLMFEAMGIRGVPLMSHHSTTGIYLTPVRERIVKYKGRCFWKPLNMPVDPGLEAGFASFIKECQSDMEYEYRVVQSGLKKWLGAERCGKKTNCGEITLLSLIKLGLLSEDEYERPVMNHLRWMCNVTDLAGGYKYHDTMEVMTHPFAT
jgi:hypothetical protein